MPISKRVETNRMVVSIVDKFDYSLQKEFRYTYEPVDENIKNYQLDLSKTTYMDSAAIGMMLVMADKVSDHATIEIINPSEDVKELLEIANISKLIPIK